MSTTQQKFAVNTRPNWAEISLSALADNYRILAGHLGPGVIPCCVIKCDAYGHGVIQCGRTLEEAGAAWLGVTSAEEGAAVRNAGVHAPILVMTGFWRGEEELLLSHSLTPAIATVGHVEALEAAARRLGRSRMIPVHLKVDTGMSRLGASLEELPALAARIAASPIIELQGGFSHLAESEYLGSPSVPHQQAAFERALKIVAGTGLRPRYRHLANTAAAVARPETWYNMVRPGLALYGYNMRCKGPGSESAQLPLRPILTWKTRIVAMREIEPSTPVGYNQRWTASRHTRLAVIPVGYGDGLNRHLSNCGQVILHDRYAPIRGNISMDLTIIDVTDIPQAALGDEVVLIGQSEHCSVGADDQAYLANTVVYEILCGLSPRVPRIYVE